jgi:DNA polymerase Ligase (LigD)
MPRFVLLEHRWNGVHYDLMLERGDVLRTWAIDAPVVPGADLPARRLPDHRPLYLDYEGEISRNRGSVRRLDAGTYAVIGWNESLIHVRLDGTQLVGEAELRQVGLNSAGDSAWILRLGNVD